MFRENLSQMLGASAEIRTSIFRIHTKRFVADIENSISFIYY